MEGGGGGDQGHVHVSSLASLAHLAQDALPGHDESLTQAHEKDDDLGRIFIPAFEVVGVGGDRDNAGCLFFYCDYIGRGWGRGRG